MRVTNRQLRRIIKEALGEFRSEDEALEYIDDIIDSSPPGTWSSWTDLAAELERDGMDKRTAERLARARLAKIWQLPRLKQDPLGRGRKTSDLRKTAMLTNPYRKR